jgi:hypothetical protein
MSTMNEAEQAEWDRFQNSAFGKKFLGDMDAAFQHEPPPDDEGHEPDEDMNRGDR